jgi:hypothetical protein
MSTLKPVTVVRYKTDTSPSRSKKATKAVAGYLDQQLESFATAAIANVKELHKRKTSTSNMTLDKTLSATAAKSLSS